MIATTPKQFLKSFGDGSRFPSRDPAVPRAVLLVGPEGFRVSEESATDNPYMTAGTAVDLERAHTQHRELAAVLGKIGVPTMVFPGRKGHDDGVFPNNSFATVPGRLIVGSMLHPVRRIEASREDIRALFRDQFQYELRDLSKQVCIAELTGPLVVDRSRRVGFCGLSSRADEAGCELMHKAFNLALTFRFALVSGEYHTNLVLAILAGRFCIIHPPSFDDPAVPDAIARVYPDNTLVLTDDEKTAIAANSIAVTERDVLLSATSRRALRPSSVEFLERKGFRLHAVEFDELEKGGGCVRCAVVEVF